MQNIPESTEKRVERSISGGEIILVAGKQCAVRFTSVDD